MKTSELQLEIQHAYVTQDEKYKYEKKNLIRGGLRVLITSNMVKFGNIYHPKENMVKINYKTLMMLILKE